MPFVLTPRATPAAPTRGDLAPSGRGHLRCPVFSRCKEEGLMPFVLTPRKLA